MNRSVKLIAGVLGCVLLFLLFASIHLSQGQSSPGYLSFWLGLFQDDQQMTFLLYNRMPRFVIGCLAGAALAVAGMLMQTMTKNPLASASTLGIHAGTYFFCRCRSHLLSTAQRQISVAGCICWRDRGRFDRLAVSRENT